MEEEQKELGFSDIMKELGKIMESLQKIMPTQTEQEQDPTPAPQPEPEKEDEPTEEDEAQVVGEADEIDKILKDC